mmetsp:Transcript_110320/g.285141  ORF Transcript_110320/g.285141 Transcript_110320/m.285141 type:complete len:228 (+) Transcript_110320:1842-2525(+)
MSAQAQRRRRGTLLARCSCTVVASPASARCTTGLRGGGLHAISPVTSPTTRTCRLRTCLTRARSSRGGLASPAGSSPSASAAPTSTSSCPPSRAAGRPPRRPGGSWRTSRSTSRRTCERSVQIGWIRTIFSKACRLWSSCWYLLASRSWTRPDVARSMSPGSDSICCRGLGRSRMPTSSSRGSACQTRCAPASWLARVSMRAMQCGTLGWSAHTSLRRDRLTASGLR